MSSTFCIVKHQLLLSLKDFPHVLLIECVQVINNGNVLLKFKPTIDYCKCYYKKKSVKFNKGIVTSSLEILKFLGRFLLTKRGILMASMVTMTQKNCKWCDISSTIFRKFNRYRCVNTVRLSYGIYLQKSTFAKELRYSNMKENS